MRRLRDSCLVVLALGLAGAGCGGPTDDLPRQSISGTVTLNGEPLKKAMIQFVPTEQGIATAGGAGVEDGAYSIPKAEGLAPGKYQVSITSTPAPAAQPAGAGPGDPVPPPKETLPLKYNAKTTLSAQVTKEGPNEFKFALTSK